MLIIVKKIIIFALYPCVLLSLSFSFITYKMGRMMCLWSDHCTDLALSNPPSRIYKGNCHANAVCKTLFSQIFIN